MKTKNIVFLLFASLLFSSGFLLVSDSTQAQQAAKHLPLDLVTKGAIILWSGDAASIPPGWQLCDGTKGTPDLRHRFVLGVQAGQDPGELGGSDWIELSEAKMPTHRHSFSTDYIGPHSHSYTDNWRTFTGHWFGIFTHYTICWPGDDFTNDGTTLLPAHQHSGTTDVQGAGELIDNRPAYCSIVFIMKL